jgi:hypothetical protein
VAEVYISYSFAVADRWMASEVADAFREAGARAYSRADSIPGSDVARWLEERISAADAVLVLVSEAGLGSSWVRREVETALAGDVLIVPVFLEEPTGRLPYGLATRRGVRLTGDRVSVESLVRQVGAAIAVRERGAARGVPGPGGPALREVRDLVVAAFASAGRHLTGEQLLQPGPVWVSGETNPSARELDRFADRLPHGRLGYFVHEGELPRDARVALDQMRVGGKPVIAVRARSLRAAHADQRVAAFLAELERDYGNRDNLFDTRNALLDERHLYGRDVLLNTIGSALRRNEHVLVTGLRKVGKTSLLNILRQHLVDRPVCQVDLQRFDRHHEDWPRTLFGLLLKAFDRWGRVERGPWPFDGGAPATTTELEAELERRQWHLGDDATTLVVVLDELERVFPAPGEEHAARQWVRASGALRSLAQGEQRHVVVVSADLRPVVNRENDLGPAGTNPFFAFFQEMAVPLLDLDAVHELVGSLARAMGVDDVADDFAGRLFELTDGHPSLVRTVAGEAYRLRRHPYALTAEDLSVALNHLEDTDSVGFFLRNNLWQLMTPVEKEVVRAEAHGWPLPGFVGAAEAKRARAALRAQGLLGPGGVRIGLFRRWLLDGEDG